LTRVDTGERFTVTAEPAASNLVTQSTLYVWIANDFAFYAIATSWFSMTAMQAHGRFYSMNTKIKSGYARRVLSIPTQAYQLWVGNFARLVKKPSLKIRLGLFWCTQKKLDYLIHEIKFYG
jgi:hypothetical protein